MSVMAIYHSQSYNCRLELAHRLDLELNFTCLQE
jgi:hypothetical protein